MSGTSESPRVPSAGRPPARRKSKPKFEIPAEAATPAAAGWVDRGAEPRATAPVGIPPRAARSMTSKPLQKTGGLSAAGSDLLAFGLATMGRTVWLGFNILTAPVRCARRLLAPD